MERRAVPILAAFSLGGRSGLPLKDVAQALRLPEVDVWDVVTRIESGGVVKEIGRGALAIEPPALREALVREVFFSGGKRLNAEGLLKGAPSPAHTAETWRPPFHRSTTSVPLIQSIRGRLDVEGAPDRRRTRHLARLVA
jgi:hypothetical protein